VDDRIAGGACPQSRRRGRDRTRCLRGRDHARRRGEPLLQPLLLSLRVLLPAASGLLSAHPVLPTAELLGSLLSAVLRLLMQDLGRPRDQRGSGGSGVSVAKRNIVVERNSCPGFSSVVGKFGLLGLSGKCCVSSVNPSVWR